MKKLYMSILVLFQMMLLCQTSVPPSAGDGTSGNPYQIETLENLYWIAATDAEVSSPSRSVRWSSYYIQTNDIDASGTSGWFPDGSGGFYGWSPIGASTPNFTGAYDGQGHTVSGLYIYRPTADYEGLFGYVSGAWISNLRIENCNFYGKNYSGAVAGYAYGFTIISGCSSSGIVESLYNYSGGITGRINTHCSIQNSFSECAVSGDDYAGGITGENYDSMVSTCFATGNVSGTNYVGGLSGASYGEITNCYATGDATGNSYVGGLIGYVHTYDISYCYSTGKPSAAGIAGGLIAHMVYSKASYCYWDIETSLTKISAGGYGYTTSQMKTLGSYTTWDFSIPVWKIVDTVIYPFLAWQPSSYITFEGGTSNGVDGEYPAGMILHLSAFLPPPGSGTAFKDWTDGDGTVLSADLEFDYTVTDQDITIYANYLTGSTNFNLTISNDGTNVILDWDDFTGAAYYQVFSTSDPYSIFRLDETGDFTGSSWTAPMSENKKFYCIVAYN